jgi:cellulose synthase/poly-beta-1,6-N-acetylglucosamine synthase-like glycosyltransferase
MPAWKLFLSHSLALYSILLAIYFILGNGIYTVLMLASIVSVWLHNRKTAYEGLAALKGSVVSPPVTVIIPAFNEERIIVGAVRSALQIDYPDVAVVVVDDGSTDGTLAELTRAFNLAQADIIYRSEVEAQRVRGFYFNPQYPQLTVVNKQNGGKADALNAGINAARSPYFSILDADCVLERNALLRLMRPIIRSRADTVASGGIIRVLNNCEVKDGQVVRVRLPRTGIERFQVVEYLRSFLFGRTGWDLTGGTLIVSGAFAVFHRETVIEAGGFTLNTVTEDMELIVRLRRWAKQRGRTIKMKFTSDPVCWSEAPSTFKMLARQRRRWHLGLCQTLWQNREMLFNPSYGSVGLLSFPFHLFIEALGAVVETVGYALIPLAILLNAKLPFLYVPFLLLALVYSAFLSVGSIVLEEMTHHRYPGFGDLSRLLVYALLENFGYRQMVLWFRCQAVLMFVRGFRQREKVSHVGAAQKTVLGRTVSLPEPDTERGSSASCEPGSASPPSLSDGTVKPLVR